jgi:hypothetical protein
MNMKLFLCKPSRGIQMDRMCSPALDGGECFVSRPGRLYPGGKPAVRIELEAGRSRELLWILRKEINLLATLVFEPRFVQFVT